MRGRAEAARRAHNPEVTGSSPVPATLTETHPNLGVFLFNVIIIALIDSALPERYNEQAFILFSQFPANAAKKTTHHLRCCQTGRREHHHGLAGDECA